VCAHLADCLSSFKEAFEMTTDIEASFAVDEDVNTHSCTQNIRSYPWWYVDLGAEYYISKIGVTLPSTGGDTRNYHLSCFIR